MKILTNALCSIAELTYWTQYINPIACLIFLGSSLVINMLLVNLILVHMVPHLLHKIDRHMTIARERKKWPIAVLNIKCFESKHRDNFSVVLHTKYLFDKTLWRVSKRCVWPSHPLLFILYLCWIFMGFVVTSHWPKRYTPCTWSHLRPFFLVIVSNYRKMSIDILKDERTSRTNDPWEFSNNIATSCDMQYAWKPLINVKNDTVCLVNKSILFVSILA